MTLRHLISDIDCEANAVSGGESLNYQGIIRIGCYLEVILAISENTTRNCFRGKRTSRGETAIWFQLN